MSKKYKNTPVPLGKPMDGRALYDYQVSYLEGQIITFIESMGFDEKREKSVRDIIIGYIRTICFLETEYVCGEFLNEAILKSRAEKEKGIGIETAFH